ncbi:hypothetical protein CC85DRAFT_270087 [Cutaneotrichosporon oleaginosum]|uniref:Ubiquitin-like domain-containing protein n=1 Tax=Cutaneotrichosporon oleaginosum TaxID=879819 RepID=A0A0J0XVF3_9TREE|nr:uncharacterized protein CC85DRAFT_270087 [Cutaneotrichosporon oleaginosum]KLT45050.1 hypothetical protein CC85DRAFT_270087 [Cutaneotrichosporon oleaginosum]TXT09734.1 hypothetical protein COLE_03668 [Cutaneotrichosporon oleaginosum]
MSTPAGPSENEPLLPAPANMGPASRSKLHARRYLPQSDKAKGKQRATTPPDDEPPTLDKGKARAPDVGRPVTIIFSNEEDAGGHLEVWVEEGESVGKVKDKIRHMRPNVAGNQLRLIHAGRLLTDGILLLPWLRSLEERVRRQAGSAVGDVLREVGRGLAGDEEEEAPPQPPQERVYLHCNVGGPLDAAPPSEHEEPDTAPRRRGFDALLDAGLSPEEVAAMRRQFYESRGEEVPDLGGMNDEHARALEEQWIEGDLTPETATTSSEGMYTAILHGLLTGFLFPLTPWFFFREEPLPNFFDAEAEADQLARRAEAAARLEDERRAAAHTAAIRGHGATGSETLEVPGVVSPVPSRESVSMRVSSSPLVGGELVGSVVFSKRMRIGIYLGTLINVVFGALRFLAV